MYTYTDLQTHNLMLGIDLIIAELDSSSIFLYFIYFGSPWITRRHAMWRSGNPAPANSL